MQSTHSNLNSGCSSLALCRHAPGSSRNCVIFSHLISQSNPCMLVAPLPSLKQVFPHTSSKPSADGLLILSRYTLGRIQSFFKLCSSGGLSINNVSFALILTTHRHFYFQFLFILVQCILPFSGTSQHLSTSTSLNFPFPFSFSSKHMDALAPSPSLPFFIF